MKSGNLIRFSYIVKKVNGGFLMRFREMGHKEIVSIKKGARLGVLGETDLLIDQKTGGIQKIIIPTYKWLGLKKEEAETTIHWAEIEKIGEDLILINDY